MVDIAYQRIAANRPAATTEAELYAVPTNTEIVANLTVVNQSASSVDISVAHTDASGVATGEDWLAFEEPLAAYSRLVIPITAKNPETIRIKAGTVDVVSFLLSGMVRSL
jgi:hypothetical protein